MAKAMGKDIPLSRVQTVMVEGDHISQNAPVLERGEVVCHFKITSGAYKELEFDIKGRVVRSRGHSTIMDSVRLVNAHVEGGAAAGGIAGVAIASGSDNQPGGKIVSNQVSNCSVHRRYKSTHPAIP